MLFSAISRWTHGALVFGTGLGSSRLLSTTSASCWIQPISRMRVVDNSALGKRAMLAGKPPHVINVYRKGKKWTSKARGRLGDMILVTIMGEMRKAYVVGQKMDKKEYLPMVPRTDTNNIVLLDDNLNPLGTRILAPIPATLREKKGDFSKVLAIATKFI